MSSERGNFSGYTRGSSRGRVRPDHGNRHYLHGGAGRGSGSSPASFSFPPEADLKKGLDTSEIIETVPLPPRPSGLEDLPIENVQYVASYNWVDTEQATIVVPGTRVLPLLVLKDVHSQPSATQVRQPCGLGLRSRSPCSPTAATIS